MPSFVWAKMWIDTLDDYKLGLLDDHLWRRFFEFVLLAKDADAGGYLPKAPAMAWRLRTNCQEIEADLQALAVDDLQLLSRDEHGEWYVTNFVKRQETAMDGAERMQRLRERQRRAAYADDCPEPPIATPDDDVTPGDNGSDDSVTQRHTEERRGDRGEGEAEEIVAASRQEVTPPEPPPKQPRTITQDDIAHPDPALVASWSDLQPELEMTIPHATYDEYLRHIRPVCVRDRCAVFITDRPHVAEWCNGRLKIPLQRTVRAIEGIDDFSVAVQTPPGGT